jgi:hypothetical protein
MKTPIRKLLLTSFLMLLIGASNSFAQKNVAEFLQGNVADAKTLSTAYMEPFGKMFGNSLNGGWYQAARPHKKFGFNVSFVVTVATVPSDAKSFDVSKLKLTNLELVNPTNNISQTVSGATSIGPWVNFKDDPSNNPAFQLPKGAGLPFTPMPIIQAGIGLPFHTEITGRFLPSLDVPKVGKVSLWGIGAKNEFKEFIPGLKMVPIDLSIFVGYTQFKSEFEIDYKPTQANTPTGYNTSDFDDQKLALNANGYTVRLLVGKTIPFLSVYVGLGYNHAVTDFGLQGNYAIGVAPNYSKVEKDPFVLNYTHSTFAGNAGLRVRLGVISINFDYTLGKYPLYSGGLGISFR